MKNQAIYPGKVWLDTNGNRIQAHGGSIMYIDGVYYWYGENKEKTDGVNGIWHWGVKCYSSTDLYNWEDRELLFHRNQVILHLHCIRNHVWTDHILFIIRKQRNMYVG